jgi:hypothetical protein
LPEREYTIEVLEEFMINMKQYPEVSMAMIEDKEEAGSSE